MELTEDVWDYLPKHSGYPSREDRDELLGLAKEDPSRMRRVRIWDFFFPLNRAIVTGLQRAELAKLYTERKRLQDELNTEEAGIRKKIVGHKEAIAKAQDDWTTNLPSFRTQMAQNLHTKIKSSQQASRGFLIAAGLLFLLIFSFVIVLASESTASASFIEEVVVPATAAATSIAIIPAFIGLIFYSQSQKNVLSELQKLEWGQQHRLAAFVGWHENNILSLESSLAARRARDVAAMDLISNSALGLEANVATLESQIPEDPSVEEVNSWLMEEIEEMQRELLQASGQEGRLVKSRTGKNIFCVRGPAELQQRDQIDPVYLLKDDLQKHLRARRAGKAADGSAIDLYGVWIMEFLFLGQDELTSYRVFYDFISKRKATRQRVHNYGTVTSIETQSQFREIEVIRDGKAKKEIVDDVPSLSFSLENSQLMEVNFPNKSYLAKALPDLDTSAKLLYEPKQEADEALRILRENVHKARTRPKSENGNERNELLALE